MTAMTTDPARRRPRFKEMGVLFFFHGALSGAFIVAYLTGDEDTYGMHVAAGYLALAALLVRFWFGLVARPGSRLRFPRPDGAATLAWAGRLWRGDPAAMQDRSPLYAWMALVMLAGTLGIAASGAAADLLPRLEGLHEGLGEAALPLALGHLALVLGLHGLRALARRAPAPAARPVPGGR